MDEGKIHLEYTKDQPRDVKNLWKNENTLPQLDLPEKKEKQLREQLEEKYGG